MTGSTGAATTAENDGEGLEKTGGREADQYLYGVNAESFCSGSQNMEIRKLELQERTLLDRLSPSNPSLFILPHPSVPSTAPSILSLLPV